MRDCSDIGKQPLLDKAECQDAASQLGLSLSVHEGSWSHNPKGCGLLKPYVYWNNHQTGSERNDWFVICRTSGMCSFTVIY